MGVSIKILHRFIQKVRDKFSKLESPFYHTPKAESTTNFPLKNILPIPPSGNFSTGFPLTKRSS
jgi:hypothetical protein